MEPTTVSGRQGTLENPEVREDGAPPLPAGERQLYQVASVDDEFLNFARISLSARANGYAATFTVTSLVALFQEIVTLRPSAPTLNGTLLAGYETVKSSSSATLNS